MRNHVSEFEAKLKEIDRDTDRIIIINAGSMNHGKSSLFNSLLDREVFKENDIRETVKQQDELWLDGVYLTDTPGLNAEEEDDREAFETYRRANMIVFVHTLNVGELKRGELEAINHMKSFFESPQFFWKHFCLTFTFIDAFRNDELESGVKAIMNKSLGDIETNCGGKDFPVFLISNSRYKKGVQENKKVFIEKSGILQLRTFLRRNIGTWRLENHTVRKNRIEREKEAMLSELNRERERVQRKINEKTAQVKERQQDFLWELEAAVNAYYIDQNELESKRDRLNALKSQLSSLRSQHQREHF